MSWTTADIQSQGAELAVDVLQAHGKRINYAAPVQTIRDGIALLGPDVKLSRQVVQFWLLLSHPRFERRCANPPPPSPFVKGKQMKVAKAKIEEWHARWLAKEEAEIAAQSEAIEAARAEAEALIEKRARLLKAKAAEQAKRKAEAVRRRVYSRSPSLQAWMVLPRPYASSIVIGHAMGTWETAEDLAQHLERGATVVYETPEHVIRRPWLSEREREAWSRVVR